MVGSPEDDPIRPLVEAVEAHTVALNRIGSNLNQITAAIHRGAIPERAETVLDRVEQAVAEQLPAHRPAPGGRGRRMVPDVSTGSDTRGLIAYLFGPGRRDEHTDPHIVAAWDMAGAPDPGRDPAATYTQLAKRLDQHVDLRTRELGGKKPPQHVWHCPVRTAPGDRYLTDAEWAEVARRVVHATGIAPDGDEKACRWIAVRHADDHIHIMATTVRADGRRPRTNRDGRRAQAECRKIEAEFGLRRLKSGDLTAPRTPTGAERAKAERQGQTRDRTAVAARAGVRGRRRRTHRSRLLHRAAVPRHQGQDPPRPRDRRGDRLQPRRTRRHQRARRTGLVRRLQTRPRPVHQPPPRTPPRPRRWPTARSPAADPGRAMAATPKPRSARPTPSSTPATTPPPRPTSPPSATPSTTSPCASPSPHRAELQAAATAFNRARRSAIRADHHAATALRKAAKELAYASTRPGRTRHRPALRRRPPGPRRRQVARTARPRTAGRSSRASLPSTSRRATSRPPQPVLADLARRAPRAATASRFEQDLRAALPDHADRILADPAWPALTTTLARAETAGHNPRRLLAEVAAQRELDTAEHPAEVLNWRITASRTGALRQLAGEAPSAAHRPCPPRHALRPRQ